MPDLSRRHFGGLAAALVLDGCSRAFPKGANGEEQRLNFYNWDTYIGETTLADFQKATGVDVRMSHYANNDELFARLRAGNPGFDVIVPSNEFVTRLQISGMLSPLDHARIPNRANLAPEFVDVPYDRGRRWSMPYTWSPIGLCRSLTRASCAVTRWPNT